MRLTNVLHVLFLGLMVLAPACVKSAPATEMPEVTFKVPDKFLAGLPVTITVEVKNNTTKPLLVLMPQDGFTLGGDLFQDGKLYESNVWICYAMEPEWVVDLAPGAKVQGICDIGKFFHPSLPAGDYTYRVRYAYAQNPHRKLITQDVRISVAEPTNKNEREAKELFGKGQTSRWNPQHYRSAMAAYASLIQRFPQSDYARIGALEKALAHKQEKEYDQAIESFKFHLNNLPRTPRGGFTPNYIEQLLAETYFASQNYSAAGEVTMKLLTSPNLSSSMRLRSERLLQSIKETWHIEEVL